jgi:hypothetical protein
VAKEKLPLRHQDTKFHEDESLKESVLNVLTFKVNEKKKKDTGLFANESERKKVILVLS